MATAETTPHAAMAATDSRWDGAFPRFYQQLVLSGLGTVFYTPGGAGGWALDLILRATLASRRRLAARRAAVAA